MGSERLTERQKDFLVRNAQGETYAQIAEKCFVSIGTVKSTFAQARSRLQAFTTAQCIVYAISREELGLTHDGLCFIPDYSLYEK